MTSAGCNQPHPELWILSALSVFRAGWAVSKPALGQVRSQVAKEPWKIPPNPKHTNQSVANILLSGDGRSWPNIKLCLLSISVGVLIFWQSLI